MAELTIVIEAIDMASPVIKKIGENLEGLSAKEPPGPQASEPGQGIGVGGYVTGVAAGVTAGGIVNFLEDLPEAPPNNFDRWLEALSVPVANLRDDLLDQFDPLFEELAEAQEHTNRVREAMELLGATYEDTGTDTVGFTGQIKLANKDIVDEAELLEQAADRQRQMNAEAERWTGMAEAYAQASERAAESTIGWQDINAGFSSVMDEQMEKLTLMEQGLGDYQQTWNLAVESVTADNEVTAEELEMLADLQDELGLSIEGVIGTAEGLDELEVSTWAENVAGNTETMLANFGLLYEASELLRQSVETLALSGAPGDFATAIEEMHTRANPKIKAIGEKVENLRKSLLGIPAKVNSEVNVHINVTGDEIPVGGGGSRRRNPRQAKIDDQDFGFARGGPLGDLALVGEEGPELIINGIVVPAQETRTLMALGLLPKRRLRAGGALEGDWLTPLQTDYPRGRAAKESAKPETQPGAGGSGGGGSTASGSRARSTRSSRRGGGGESLAVSAILVTEAAASAAEAAAEVSVASVIPDVADAAASAAAAVAPTALASIAAQLNNESARRMESSNEKLIARVDQLILENRRLKTYFRDAVRLMSE